MKKKKLMEKLDKQTAEYLARLAAVSERPEPANDPKPAPENCCFSVREPGTLQRAEQLLRFIGELEATHNEIRARLFGGILPTVVFPQGDGLDEMIANGCTRVASLVGDARTICKRLAD